MIEWFWNWASPFNLISSICTSLSANRRLSPLTNLDCCTPPGERSVCLWQWQQSWGDNTVNNYEYEFLKATAAARLSSLHGHLARKKRTSGAASDGWTVAGQHSWYFWPSLSVVPPITGFYPIATATATSVSVQLPDSLFSWPWQQLRWLWSAGKRELTGKTAGAGGKLQPLDQCQLSEIYIHTKRRKDKAKPTADSLPFVRACGSGGIYGKFTAYIPAPCRIKCGTFPDDGDTKGYRSRYAYKYTHAAVSSVDEPEGRSTGFWLPASTYFRFVGRHFVADAGLNNKFYN